MLSVISQLVRNVDGEPYGKENRKRGKNTRKKTQGKQKQKGNVTNEASIKPTQNLDEEKKIEWERSPVYI